jgi:hypothetical protein
MLYGSYTAYCIRKCHASSASYGNTVSSLQIQQQTRLHNVSTSPHLAAYAQFAHAVLQTQLTAQNTIAIWPHALSISRALTNVCPLSMFVSVCIATSSRRPC